MENLYEIEAIRKIKWESHQIKFFIKWKGWPEKDNTWEPF